jgi:cation diffusion facilitator family transporter
MSKQSGGDILTELLLRLFIKDREHTDDPDTRADIGKLAGITGIVCNLLLFAGKLIMGLLSGALSIVADAINNLTDASSSVVTLLGFRMAQQPADEDHPFGHARYEYLSGLAVSALILVIGFELATSSVKKIIHPEAVEFSYVAILVLVASIAVKLWMSLFFNKLGKTIRSTALTATAADSRNDCVATGAVLAGLLIGHFLKINVDGWFGLGVALFILWSGIQNAKETISPLLGEGADPALREELTRYISGCPCVIGCHDLMVHDYGPGRRYASIHVEMDKETDALLCHEMIDGMERECLNRFGVHLVIHYDPVITDDPALNRLRCRTEQLLKAQDSRLGVHDFRMVQGAGHTNLIFDVALPTDMDGRRKELTNLVQDTLSQEENTQIYAVITFDPAPFN